MGQQPALQRLLAHPDHVGGEVGKAQLGELGGHPGVVLGPLAGEHQQLLGPVARHRPVEDLEHLVGLVQVRLMRRERAVLAVAAARPAERQREVAAERDAAATHVRGGF